MQYHALSLLEHGYRVTILGYCGEDLIPQLTVHNENRPLLTVKRMSPPPVPKIVSSISPLRLLFRLISLIWVLVGSLFSVKNPAADVVLVQNPPPVPLLFLAWLYCKLHRAAFIIDWHNLGFTMFELQPWHPITVVVRLYERLMAPLSDVNFCVSSAMSNWLKANFGIRCRVLRDRPPDFFHATSIADRHELMLRLMPCFASASERLDIDLYRGVDEVRECTVCTLKRRGKVELREDRPKIIVSSTSWTPDEDFAVLLEALILLEEKLNTHGKKDQCPPKVLVVITGKGPQKAYYESKMSKLTMRNVHVMTIWLEAGDYPKFLGCADLGISLHTSTSGIDLPMKVLDFYGGELPVCARNFECLDELVQHGSNGMIFESCNELADQMFDLLVDEKMYLKLKEGVRGMIRWRENWVHCAADIIQSTSS